MAYLEEASSLAGRFSDVVDVVCFNHMDLTRGLVLHVQNNVNVFVSFILIYRFLT